MFLFIYLVLIFFSADASAERCAPCEQCDTSKALFFATDSGLASGACAYGPLALDMYDGNVAAARSNVGGGCGACYQVRCENSPVCSKTGTTIVVTDSHIDKTNATDFVLSNRAFKAMALPGKEKQLLGLGIVDVEYKRVPCVYKGHNLTFQVENYSKPPNYIAIKILYQGGQTSILTADVRNGSYPCPMSHNYGVVWDANNVPKGPLEFQFYIVSGYDGAPISTNQVLPANWKPGGVYSSNVQITEIAIQNCKPCIGFKL